MKVDEMESSVHGSMLGEASHPTSTPQALELRLGLDSLMGLGRVSRRQSNFWPGK